MAGVRKNWDRESYSDMCRYLQDECLARMDYWGIAGVDTVRQITGCCVGDRMDRVVEPRLLKTGDRGLSIVLGLVDQLAASLCDA